MLKQVCPVIAWVRGGGLPTGWPGFKCLFCARGTQGKHCRPGTWLEGSVTGVTEKLFMCQMFMCLLWPLNYCRDQIMVDPEKRFKK